MENFEPNTDLPENSDLEHLQLFFYLIPILGFFPSLWTLYDHSRKRAEGAGGAEGAEGAEGENSIPLPFTLYPLPFSPHEPHSEKLAVSRLSITLALGWLMGYVLLNIGAETSDFLTFRLLMLNSLLTSGYFLVSIWLMVRLVSRKSVRLPGISRWAERVMGKHLS